MTNQDMKHYSYYNTIDLLSKVLSDQSELFYQLILTELEDDPTITINTIAKVNKVRALMAVKNKKLIKDLIRNEIKELKRIKELKHEHK